MTDKRVLLVGAETDIGRASSEVLAAAGARLALVSSTTDAQAAFAVQRLARKLGAVSQAIDATNEAAVRVMVRQVAKQLGGIDATVVCVQGDAVVALVERFAVREMRRSGTGAFVDAQNVQDIIAAVEAPFD